MKPWPRRRGVEALGLAVYRWGVAGLVGVNLPLLSAMRTGYAGPGLTGYAWLTDGRRRWQVRRCCGRSTTSQHHPDCDGYGLRGVPWAIPADCWEEEAEC